MRFARGDFQTDAPKSEPAWGAFDQTIEPSRQDCPTIEEVARMVRMGFMRCDQQFSDLQDEIAALRNENIEFRRNSACMPCSNAVKFHKSPI